MLRPAWRELVAVLLLVVCPVGLLMADQPNAVLYATGAVTLNGTPAAKSMPVFAGDRIDTQNASAVSVSRSGFSLVVASDSSVQYESNGFTILKGKASARTKNGMLAQAGPLSVIAKSDSALFDLSRDGKKILVASREGTLTLTDGVQTALLEPGYTAVVTIISEEQEPRPAANASGQQPNQYPTPSATSAGQEEGPKPAATTRGDENPHKKVIIWIILSAAAAAAIICSLECGGGGRVPVSPVTP